jgi:hypothetical protein
VTVTTLDPTAVSEIFRACLAPEDDRREWITVEGVVNVAHFYVDRIALHEDRIDAWLNALPSESHEDGGGGWSLLQACTDRSGLLWTSEQRVAEQLLMLGMARGRVICQLPREVWPSLPGGVPYYVIKAKP